MSGPGFVGIKFCQECNNMLYPKEDKENKVLMYACRNCEFKQPADNNCIYVNKIMHDVDELTQIVSDVISDPTLPRSAENPCPKCKHDEAVFFQAQTRRAEEEMKLYYVCTNANCTHREVFVMQNPAVWTLKASQGDDGVDAGFRSFRFDLAEDSSDLEVFTRKLIADDLPLKNVSFLMPCCEDAGQFVTAVEQTLDSWELSDFGNLSVRSLASPDFLVAAAKAQMVGVGTNTRDSKESASFSSQSRRLILRLRSTRLSTKNFPRKRCKLDSTKALFSIKFDLEKPTGTLSRKHLIELCGDIEFNFEFVYRKGGSGEILRLLPSADVLLGKAFHTHNRIIENVEGVECSLKPSDEEAEDFLEWLNDVDIFPQEEHSW
ncbi:unnamed protein product [Notodromas monacha]|uniref:TFIIS-type domain-containing protein n=1 Tax=Notodromas monacha TaxID=399045 RepID=A0A7R9BYL6_9CRUS|nr:unnamed protein product [Notodromas monacha]CAG0923231.1 unnamed protein product [Notodromas monacha]